MNSKKKKVSLVNCKIKESISDTWYGNQEQNSAHNEPKNKHLKKKHTGSSIKEKAEQKKIKQNTEESEGGQIKGSETKLDNEMDVDSSSSTDVDSSSTEDTKETSIFDQEMATVKRQLMEMPFEEIQKLKEKIGLKAYRQAMFGAKPDTHINPRKRVFKRKNKNRPMEVTSKIPVSRYKAVMSVKKKVHRDPRFDDLSGDYNEDLFKKSYAFIDDIKQKEKQVLMKQHRKEKAPEKKEKLGYLIKRMDQQERAERERDIKQKRQTDRRKKERDMVKDGKKPYYLKKADQKTLDLAEKYKELKKSGKLDKYLERKRKKNASKEKRKLPNGP